MNVLNTERKRMKRTGSSWNSCTQPLTGWGGGGGGGGEREGERERGRERGGEREGERGRG